MRFGALTLQNVSWPELVEQWKTLEELGLETVWIADHLANPYDTGQPWLEAWTCLAALARETSSVRLGPLVSPITFRNPAVLAKAAVTVDHISNGRLELGVGAGGAAYCHELAGVPLWEPKERAGRLAAFVESLHGHLTGELRPAPAQPRIPITIGGHSPTALRVTAQHASRWNTYVGAGLDAKEALRRVRTLNAKLDSLCAEQGRDPTEICRSILMHSSYVGEEPWRSELAFLEVVDRWGEAGIDELVFYYPPLDKADGAVQPGLFEHAMRKLAPQLR